MIEERPGPAEWSGDQRELARFSMVYKFAIDEVTTKINILREEFNQLHEYNPIEHVKARLKTPESIVAKARRRGCGPSLAALRDTVQDIAGVRVVCSFKSDVYSIFEMFTASAMSRSSTSRTTSRCPRPNGYQSLHTTVQVPVYMSQGAEDVFVEMQFRTVAMDFWASLEHKIFYKYDRAVPAGLLAELREAAETAAQLDERMERLHTEVAALPADRRSRPPGRLVTPSYLAGLATTPRPGIRP